ncbi:unnamed protein product, partial [Polarella glacialis]
VPPEALFWDFIDVVGNETAPKAIYLGTDAAKRNRPDVKLQHENAEALIEHLGDVSSLSGKVQRATENYFKKHVLVDTLFDNPAGKMRTNLRGRLDMLQSLYDGTQPEKQVTCGGHSAIACSSCAQGHGASWCNVECMWASGVCNAVFKTDAVQEVSSEAEAWTFNNNDQKTRTRKQEQQKPQPQQQEQQQRTNRMAEAWIELVLDAITDVEMVNMSACSKSQFFVVCLLFCCCFVIAVVVVCYEL